jgi:toluene monooxygenase system ferredoxin subunit
MTFLKAATLDELWSGEMRGVIVGGTKVLLLNLDGNVLAYEDRCAHKGVELSKGRLHRTVLTCSAHSWEYDVASGRGLNPRHVCLRTFDVKLVGEDILVDVNAEAGMPGDDHIDVDIHHDDVGPVLQAGPLASAVVAAIRQLNEIVDVVDRGAYLRVRCPRRCLVTRAAIEACANRPFRLPQDLELIMSSFKGRFHVSEDDARWEISSSRAPAGPGGEPG